MTNVRHGHALKGKRTPEYMIWQGIKKRCHTPTVAGYKDYGARGITVCDRWRNSFEAFFADMGHRPSPEHSLDRIDNNDGYHQYNCRWATDLEQARNKKNNVFLTLNGQTKTIAEWCDELGRCRSNVWHRLKRGWSAEDALTRPVLRRGPLKRGAL